MSDRQTSTFRTLASHNTTKQASWSPGYYYDDRHLLEQLQACSSLLSTVAQRTSEKNVIIHNLQENFNRERNAMLYEISTLKWQLVREKQNAKIAMQKREISYDEEGEKVCRDGGAETTKPEVEPEQAGEWRLKSLEAEHQASQPQPELELEPESEPQPEPQLQPQPQPHRRGHVQVVVQRRAERPAPPSPQAAETECWQSARETVSPSIEHAPQQGQGQARRKRKRALRGGDCS